jgi:tRNA(adenine34) deaminase
MNDQHYMTICLKLAQQAALRDEVPVGAVIVQNDVIIAEASNEKVATQDPTAHAEIIAIKQASQKLNNWRLSDCTLYVTLEPCPMCAGAIVQSRIKRVVYGCKDLKSGAVDSIYQITQDQRLNHQTEVTAGVLAQACSELLTTFFKSKR